MPSTLRVNHDFNIHAPADATAQHGTLAWAVANAQNGDTILLTADAAKTGITLTQGDLLLTQRNLTIKTEAGAPPVTISGGNLSRIFEVATGASVTLSNLVITGGKAGLGQGGGIDNFGTVTLTGCTVSGNSADFGGGIFNVGGTLAVENGSSITGNAAPVGSGADVYSLGVVYLDSSSTIGALEGNPAQPI